MGLLEGSVHSNLSVMLKHCKTEMLPLKCSKPWENIFEKNNLPTYNAVISFTMF